MAYKTHQGSSARASVEEAAYSWYFSSGRQKGAVGLNSRFVASGGDDVAVNGESAMIRAVVEGVNSSVAPCRPGDCWASE